MSNEATLRAFIQRVWNEHDKSAVAEFLHSSYTIFLDGGDPYEGLTLSQEEFIKRLDASFVPFPDIHFEIQTLIEELNTIGITWIMTGTNLGPLGRYPATGKPIKTNGITIYHFTHGKISGHSQVYDSAVISKQLGFM